MFYDRKIKYVDVYENGEKVQNAGFAKIEVKGEEVVLQLQISKLRITDTCKCPVILTTGEKEAQIGELDLEAGKGTWESDKLDISHLSGDIEYTRLQEICMKLPGGRMLRCIIKENVEAAEDITDQGKEEILPEPAFCAGEAVKEQAQAEGEREKLRQELLGTDDWQEQAELQQESLSLDEFEEYEEYQEVISRPNDSTKRTAGTENANNRSVKEDRPKSEALPVQRIGAPLASAGKWQQLLAIYPHIRPFEDMREYLMIKPGDLVVLPEKYFSLSGNSFLLHGYYNYEHLILTKEERDREEKFYIGVPGNFYHKEKQVAVLFGFESFEGKTEPARNGDFGYYMIPVEL